MSRRKKIFLVVSFASKIEEVRDYQRLCFFFFPLLKGLHSKEFVFMLCVVCAKIPRGSLCQCLRIKKIKIKQEWLIRPHGGSRDRRTRRDTSSGIQTHTGKSRPPPCQNQTLNWDPFQTCTRECLLFRWHSSSWSYIFDCCSDINTPQLRIEGAQECVLDDTIPDNGRKSQLDQKCHKSQTTVITSSCQTVFQNTSSQ